MLRNACLWIALFLFLPLFSAAAQAASSPAETAAASPSASTANADEQSPAKALDKDLEPAARATRILPAGLEPNPPKPEELKLLNATWKGEYEADHDGKPVLGPDALPIAVLYNKKGKRMKARIKAAKTRPLSVVAGTLTVDGWTGKARLNYDIPEGRFIYISTPDVGTIIIAQTAFPGSKEQKDAINGKTLSIKAGDHDIQLASDNELVGKAPRPAWVRIDTAFTQDPKYPVMGYGSATHPPYEWPGAKQVKEAGVADAPPLPPSMRPKPAVPVCVPNARNKCPAAVVSQTAAPIAP